MKLLSITMWAVAALFGLAAALELVAYFARGAEPNLAAPAVFAAVAYGAYCGARWAQGNAFDKQPRRER